MSCRHFWSLAIAQITVDFQHSTHGGHAQLDPVHIYELEDRLADLVVSMANLTAATASMSRLSLIRDALRGRLRTPFRRPASRDIPVDSAFCP